MNVADSKNQKARVATQKSGGQRGRLLRAAPQGVYRITAPKLKRLH